MRNELGRRRKKYLRVCLETISFIPGLYSKWYKSFIHVQGLFFFIFIQGSKNFGQKNRDAGKRHKAKKKWLFLLSNFEIITSTILPIATHLQITFVAKKLVYCCILLCPLSLQFFSGQYILQQDLPGKVHKKARK